MKMTLRIQWFVFAYFAFCTPLMAQEKKPMLVPNDGTFKVLAAQPAMGRVVRGAPYSATATTETVQTLSDGNQIIHKNESNLYRDSEGRMRTEQTLETIGKWATNGATQQIITIHDPVTGVSYSLDARTQTAHETVMPPPKPAPVTKAIPATGNSQPPPAPSPDESKQAKPAPPMSPKSKLAYTSKKESLGRQMMEGVEVEGARVTVTIPAGEVGNTRPLEIIDEAWYSPALQISLMTKHYDPRSGETTYRLTNLKRNEPDRALFEVPDGYTISVKKAPTQPKLVKEE